MNLLYISQGKGAFFYLTSLIHSFPSHSMQTCNPQEQSGKTPERELASCAIASAFTRKPFMPTDLQICVTHILHYISCSFLEAAWGWLLKGQLLLPTVPPGPADKAITNCQGLQVKIEVNWGGSNLRSRMALPKFWRSSGNAFEGNGRPSPLNLCSALATQRGTYLCLWKTEVPSPRYCSAGVNGAEKQLSEV